MTTIAEKREEFREYLKSAGVIDSLSHALMKLYDETEKPDDPVKFIRAAMCESCPTEDQFNSLRMEHIETLEKLQALKREVAILNGSAEIRPTNSETQLALEEGMKSLEEDEECHSLLKKHMTREIYEDLKTKMTSLESTLLDCIQSGLMNHDSGCGIYAPDAEAYTVFGGIFDPVIDDYHGGFGPTDVHPPSEFGETCCFPDLDPEQLFIISTRVRCGRSIKGYPFNPRMTRDDYLNLEKDFRRIVEEFEDEELKGTYYSLAEMEPETQQQLIDDHFLFKEGDRFLQTANACRFWPDGRGIFLNDAKTFLIWCNEEDHLRIISMEPGGNLGNVYARMIKGVQKLGEHFEYVVDERFGYLTFCPTNLGTTIRASVHIKIPKLSSDRAKLEEIAAKHHLQVRGTRGEHTDSEDGVYDISNKRRLGLTEFDAVKEMFQGVKEMIKIEKEME